MGVLQPRKHRSKAKPFPAHRILPNRAEIEDEIERLIALLDRYDGDCDLEDDDPAGGNIEDQRQDPMHYRLPPEYGANQTRMINERLILRDYHRQMMGEGAPHA